MALNEKIKEFVGDVSKLQVTTLTGNLKLDVILADDEGNIQFKSILKNLKGSENKPSSIEIVATTEVDFDKDVVQYVQKGTESALLDLHNKTVVSSQEARAAFVKAIIDFIPI